MSIVLTRIDDRLIHGQVVTQWVRLTKCNRIIVLDNGVKVDPFMTMVCKKLAPTGTTVEIMSVEDGIRDIPGYITDDAVKAIILTKTPKPILELKKAGVGLEKMVIGGMGMRNGRTKLFRNISADEEERVMLRELLNMGMHITCQIVPDDITVDVKTLV